MGAWDLDVDGSEKATDVDGSEKATTFNRSWTWTVAGLTTLLHYYYTTARLLHDYYYTTNTTNTTTRKQHYPNYFTTPLLHYSTTPQLRDTNTIVMLKVSRAVQALTPTPTTLVATRTSVGETRVGRE